MDQDTRKGSEGSSEIEDKPAFEEAGIKVRPDGSQIHIKTGRSIDTGDREDLDTDQEGTRGKIQEYSEASQRRLVQKAHALRREDLTLFLTLTYHETIPSPEECHAHLERFFKRLERRFPEIAWIWKKEPQEDGTPHFHLLVAGPTYIPAQWISSLWHDVTDETSSEHDKSGVDIEATRWDDGADTLLGYVGKYMGKEGNSFEGVPGWENPGRFWGVMGHDRMPWAAWSEWTTYLHQHEAEYLIRELLDEWDADLPDGVIPPSLTINTRGDPTDRLDDLLRRL